MQRDYMYVSLSVVVNLDTGWFVVARWCLGSLNGLATCQRRRIPRYVEQHLCAQIRT